MQMMDKDNRSLRLQVEELQERADMSERRVREAMSKQAESERCLQRLSLEEGCRERLVEALRQLEEETQSKLVAEQQVRGQMDRIHTLTMEREEVLRELERERADKVAAQAALSEANAKNYEFMRSLGSAEQAKQTLQGQVRRERGEGTDGS